MARDVNAAQRVLAQLLTDAHSRRAWQDDPRAFAAAHLRGSEEIEMIAGLSSTGIAAAALHLDLKRIGSRRNKPDREPHRAPSPRVAGINAIPVPAPVPASQWPLVGLGYWPDLAQALSRERAPVDVWELRIDDYLDPAALDGLRSRLRATTVVIHSVDLSLGSPEATADAASLRAMRSVLAEAGARDLSDHLGFTRVAGRSLGHFEPVWRIEEALALMARNVARLQDSLGVRLALENIAPTFDPGGDMSEAEFLNQLVSRTGCGVLLDITNLCLNERNGFCDAAKELDRLGLDAVVGVHLAGGAEVDGLAFDAHAHPVEGNDLAWLERLLPRMPHCRSIVIERDGRRERINEVATDLQQVRAVLQRAAPCA